MVYLNSCSGELRYRIVLLYLYPVNQERVEDTKVYCSDPKSLRQQTGVRLYSMGDFTGEDSSVPSLPPSINLKEMLLNSKETFNIAAERSKI